MSLLREIQNDLSSEASDITTVLMKCKILAARLGSRELAQWTDYELNGYPDDQALPDYRTLGIKYFASFSSAAWRAEKQAVPLYVVPEEYRDSFQRSDFCDGIKKAVSFAQAKEGFLSDISIVWSGVRDHAARSSRHLQGVRTCGECSQRVFAFW